MKIFLSGSFFFVFAITTNVFAVDGNSNKVILSVKDPLLNIPFVLLNPPPKVTQELGLPDLNKQKLFALIDDLNTTYSKNKSRIFHLDELYNALILQEYKRLEVIKETMSFEVKANNRPYQVEMLSGLITNSEKKINQLITLREEVIADFELKKNTFSLSEERLDKMIEDLFSAQKKEDTVFNDLLEKYTPEIKGLLSSDKKVSTQKKEQLTALEIELSTLKKTVFELEIKKQVIDQEIEQFSGQLSNAKKKEIPVIENAISERKSIKKSLESENKFIQEKELTLLKKKEDLNRLIEIVTQFENFNGTPVSIEMLEQAERKANSLVISETPVNNTPKNTETPIQSKQYVQEDKELYAFVSDLSEIEQEILNSIDKDYVTKTKRLETIVLNSSGKRVLIDLHRKMLDMVEIAKGELQFGDRKENFINETERLDDLDQKITVSIQLLNQELSEEEVDKTIKENVENGTPITNSSIEIKETIVESDNDAKITDVEEVTLEKIVLEENIVKSYYHSEPRLNTELSKEWEEVVRKYDAVSLELSKQTVFYRNATSKSQKKDLKWSITELEKQLKELDVAKQEAFIKRLRPYIEPIQEGRFKNFYDLLATQIEVLKSSQEQQKDEYLKLELIKKRLDKTDLIYNLSTISKYDNVNTSLKAETVQVLSKRYLENPLQLIPTVEDLIENEIIADKTKLLERKIKATDRKVINTEIEIKENVYEELQQLKFDFQKQKNTISTVVIEGNSNTKYLGEKETEEIRSSKEYAEYVRLKAPYLSTGYELQLTEIQLERDRNELTYLFLNEGKSSLFNIKLSNLKENYSRQNLLKEKFEKSQNDFNRVKPNDIRLIDLYAFLMMNGIQPTSGKDVNVTEEFSNVSTIEEEPKFEYNKGIDALYATPLEIYNGLFYTIQFGVFSKPLSAERLLEDKKVYTYRLETGQIRYSFGVFIDLDGAREMERKVKGDGFQNAFITSYYKGERVSLSQASDLISKGVKPSLMANKVVVSTSTKPAEKPDRLALIPLVPAKKEVVFAQLVSKDQFSSPPIDFLNRLRISDYFYFDSETGRVRSQIKEENEFLYRSKLLMDEFNIVTDKQEIKRIREENYVYVTLPLKGVPGDLADLLVRLNVRMEIVSLENSYELRIFVEQEETKKWLKECLNEIGFSVEFKNNIQDK